MTALNLYVDLDNIATAREFVARKSDELGLDRQVAFALQLAVDEACTNILNHACGGQGGNLELSMESVDGGVQLVTSDWGAAFDPRAVPSSGVMTLLDQRALGGLGLYLMQQTMDRVLFAFDPEQGNTLMMVNYCQTDGGGNGVASAGEVLRLCGEL